MTDLRFDRSLSQLNLLSFSHNKHYDVLDPLKHYGRLLDAQQWTLVARDL